MRAAMALAGAVGVAMCLYVPLTAQERAVDASVGFAGQRGVGAAAGAQDSVSPLERIVSLDLRDVPLNDALKEINRQARLGLMYTPRVVPVEQRVTIHVEKITAGAALERVLRGTGVKVTMTPAGIVMLVKQAEEAAADAKPIIGSIVGSVRDTAGVALAQVEVSLRGVDLRTTTNDSGRYMLREVPAGSYEVVARTVGYAPAVQQVVVTNRDVVRIDFTLRRVVTRLMEVVTTATGERRRLEVGNDVTVINADSIVATQPIASVIDLLEGRVPGLVVQRTSGAPGDPSRIRLRGTSSVYANNDPIWIVDGVRVYAAQSDERNHNLVAGAPAPSPVDYLDPHSIETIEVFKGPSAATLYGADAANGVIVVTTKKGRPGPSRWTASVERGMSYMPGRFPSSYVRWGHRPGQSEAVLCTLTDPSCVADSLVSFQPLNDKDLTILDRGAQTTATVGVSGGTEAVSYNLSGSYARELGVVRLPDFEAARYRATHGNVDAPDWMQRPQAFTHWGVNSGLNLKLGPTAELSVSAMLSRGRQQRSSLEGELLSMMATYVDRATGTYYRPVTGVASAMLPTSEFLTNYYQLATAEATQLTNGVDLTWRPWAWLTASANVGLNLMQRDDQFLLRRNEVVVGDSVGRIGVGRGSSLVTTGNLRATARAHLAGGFGLQLSAGANYTQERTADVTVTGRDLTTGGTSLAQARVIENGSEQRLERAVVGWYVEPSLSHKRLWLSAGLRLDGGSAFGRGVSLVPFPKLSASYLISDEPFFPFKSIFNTLRLRAAFGHAGVQPNPQDHLRLYSQATRTWVDGRSVDAVLLASLGNTQLRPERSKELELGFDADLFDDRLSLGLTGYRKTRVDALMSFLLPPSVYDEFSILRNIGTIRNSGVEFTMGMQPVRSDLASVKTEIGVSHNRNMVVELGPGVEPFFTGDGGRVAPGYPLGGRWARPVLGYHDLNGDGLLEASEVVYGDTAVYVGSPAPDYNVGLQTTLTLFRGALQVSGGWTYQSGVTQVGPWSQLRGVLRAENDPTAPLAEQAAVVSSSTSDFLSTETVSALRFNTLSVEYTVPAGLARRLGTRALSVFLLGTNLGLRTNYRGKDPNVNGTPYGDGLRDLGQLPEPRTWCVRVNASY